jgi:hypothetical protein
MQNPWPTAAAPKSEDEPVSIAEFATLLALELRATFAGDERKLSPAAWRDELKLVVVPLIDERPRNEDDSQLAGETVHTWPEFRDSLEAMGVEFIDPKHEEIIAAALGAERLTLREWYRVLVDESRKHARAGDAQGAGSSSSSSSATDVDGAAAGDARATKESKPNPKGKAHK